MKKKRLMRLAAIVACLALVVQVLDPISIGATVDDSGTTEVTSEYVSLTNAEIEQSSLIIGSYVINIKGITDDIYDAAVESATEFQQQNMYYKSELAGGQWYDVTSASSLSDIMTTGTSVDASVIEALKFTHKVSADGAVTDLRYGYSVSAFDVTSPYDLWDLEELDPIETQLTALQQKNSQTESDQVALSALQEFYGKSIRNSTTNKYDNIISGLESYKNGLTGRGKSSTWVEEVQKVMKHTDALRRVEAFTILSENLNELLITVSGGDGTPGYYDDDNDWEEVDEYYTNSDLTSAIGEAVQNVEDSITEYSAMILTEGSTTTSRNRYQYTNDLMNSVNVTTTTTYEYDNLPWYARWYSTWIRVRATTTISCDQATADTATQKLVDMANIAGGTIVDADSELSTLASLTAGGLADYKTKLAAGISEDYQNAVISGAAESVKTKCLTDQKNDTDATRLEYQDLLEAYFDRMSNTSKQQTIEGLLNGIPELEALVPADAVQSYQLETVSDHRDWLRQQLAKAIAESEDGSEMDALQSALEDLETQKQTALDNNDLAEAKRLDAEMEAKQTDIDNLTASLLTTATSGNSSESDKAKALASLGDGNAASAITALGSEIAASIRGLDGTDSSSMSGSYENDLLNKMAALSALSDLNPNAANAALSDVQGALDGIASLDSSLLDSLKESASDMQDSIDDALSGTSGSSGASGSSAYANGASLSSSALKNMLEDILGCSMDEASSLQLAAAVLALSQFGYDYGNNNARNLAITYASKMHQDGDSYIYDKLTASTAEYVSLRAIGAVLGYRYVFDNAHISVTLSKGREYATFVKDETEYTTTGEKTKTLKAQAAFQKTLYLKEADAYTIYRTNAGYVRGSDYAIVETTEVTTLWNQIYDQMVDQL